MKNAEYPQLKEIKDTKILAETLQNHLGARFSSGEFQVESCRIRKLYYKPGTNGGCRLHFKALIGRNGNGVGVEQTFFGHILPSDQVQERLTAVSSSPHLVQPKFGAPITLIPQWDMILWAYPNDPNLPGLPVLTQPERVLQLMQAAPERFGLPADAVIQKVDAHLTKYVPGRRCGYRYEVYLTSATAMTSTGPTATSVCTGEEVHTVYAKAYRREAGEKASRVWQQVWDSDARKQGKLHLPEPYGYDAEHHILWQETLQGKPLAKVVPNNLPSLAGEIGGQLAALHNLDLELPIEITLAAELDSLQTAVSKIQHAFPDVAERCQRLHQQLVAASSQLDTIQPAPVHGSFKFSHIFADGGHIGLIDFDGTCLGDPGYDLGRFLAYVQGMAAKGKISEEDGRETAVNFLAAYHAAAHQPISHERVNWFTASLLVSSHLYKTVKRFRPRLVDGLLQLAEQAVFGQA